MTRVRSAALTPSIATSVVAAIGLLAMAVWFGAAATPVRAAEQAVTIEDFLFDPANLTIAVGDTVTWTNLDSFSHTATSTSGPASFDSGNLATDETFSFTFDTAGTYEYFCEIHPNMTGTIMVTDGASSAPAPSAPASSAPASSAPASSAPASSAPASTPTPSAASGAVEANQASESQPILLYALVALVVLGGLATLLALRARRS